MKIHFDVLILTALAMEWRCVGRVFDRAPSDALRDGPYTYFASQLAGSEACGGNHRNFSRNLNIGIFCAIRAGNHQMAAVTAELIEKYSPSLVLLVGIAAGRKQTSVQYGDVIVPGMILDFSTSGAHGKKTEAEDETPPVVSEPVHESITYALRNVAFTQPDECRLATSFVELGTFHQLLEKYSAKELLPVGVDSSEWRAPKLLDGVLASANVLSRASSLLETLATFNEQVRGTEMEAAGFATACERAHVPWAIGKSISDWGGDDKVDGYHQFAATTSAVWARCLLSTCIEHGMFFEHGDPFSDLAKLKAIQSMLAYIGARIEAHNPLLKMNIQIYRTRKTPNGQFLTLESGWS
jgi:nucleoside phosphorylase